MKRELFSYRVTPRGYMLYYRERSIGGAGTLGRTRLYGNQGKNNLKGFTEDAEREITRIVAGDGQQRFKDEIAKIDSENQS